MVVLNAVNDVRDIGRAHGHAHIYRLNTVVERGVNLVIRLLVGAREQIAVKVEVVGEGVSVDINAADLPNGSSAAGNLLVGVGVLFGGYGNLFQSRSVRQLGFLDNRGRYTVGAVVCNSGLFICARRAARKQNRRNGSRKNRFYFQLNNIFSDLSSPFRVIFFDSNLYLLHYTTIFPVCHHFFAAFKNFSGRFVLNSSRWNRSHSRIHRSEDTVIDEDSFMETPCDR